MTSYVISIISLNIYKMLIIYYTILIRLYAHVNITFIYFDRMIYSNIF